MRPGQIAMQWMRPRHLPEHLDHLNVGRQEINTSFGQVVFMDMRPTHGRQSCVGILAAQNLEQLSSCNPTRHW